MSFDWSELGNLLTQAIGFRRRRSDPIKAVKATPWPVRRGTLALIGGTLEDEVAVELIHRAGGRRARAVVLPAAHLEFGRAGERYMRYLTRFGMERVEAVDMTTRRQAEDRSLAERLDVDLVVVGGGDVGLLLNLIAGTAAERALVGGLGRGAVVALTGDAAAAVGDVVLDWSAPRGAAIRRGLGLLPQCLVDRQAARRGEVGRLFAAVSSDRLGISLDEGTALLCGPGAQAEVRGRGAALVIDGRRSRTDPSVSGIPTHVLPEGWRVDLASRLVLPPAPVGVGVGAVARKAL